MAQTTQTATRPGFTFARVMGATALALGLMLGILGGQQDAAAASPITPTPAVAESVAPGEAGLVQAGFKIRKGFGHGYGHGFKHGYGVKKFSYGHGHKFKYGHRAKRFGFGHGYRHGFKTYRFGHGRGVKKFGYRYH